MQVEGFIDGEGRERSAVFAGGGHVRVGGAFEGEGRAQRRVGGGRGEDGGGGIRIIHSLNGRESAQFLAHIKRLLEDPAWALVEA